jgi:hypothetical protein
MAKTRRRAANGPRHIPEFKYGKRGNARGKKTDKHTGGGRQGGKD